MNEEKPKTRIYKMEKGKKICGVCAGLADSLNIDVTIVRVLWLIAMLCYGTGFLLYFGCALIFPKKEEII